MSETTKLTKWLLNSGNLFGIIAGIFVAIFGTAFKIIGEFYDGTFESEKDIKQGVKTKMKELIDKGVAESKNHIIHQSDEIYNSFARQVNQLQEKIVERALKIFNESSC